MVINDQLTLNCPAEGIPPPKITWKRQGKIIQQYSNPSIRILDNGKKLFIASAQLLDLGDYQCLVENVAGNSSVDYFVSVQGNAFLQIWQNAFLVKSAVSCYIRK